MRRGSKRNRQLDTWVGIPALNLLATFRRRNRFPALINKIGLMCSPALGDTLLFSAVAQDLRAYFPAQELVHFCMPENLAAANMIPGIDRRILIDLARPLTAIKALRAEKVDLMLDFTSWQKLTAFYTMMSGARFTVGFSTAGQHRSRGYDISVEHRRDLHEIDNHRLLLSALKIPTGHAPAITVHEAALPAELDAAEEIIVFHLWPAGVASWMREWPEERWMELASNISSPGTLFVITGGPADQPRSESFVQKLQQAGLRSHVFTGRDGMGLLCCLLLRAKLLVSVNTGVMHLAAILGTPTISLNGPTAAHRWGALGPHTANVAPADGSGGYLHLGFEYEGQPKDVMLRISTAQVLAAVTELQKRS
jgi:heptosyltransferase-3